MSEALVKLKSEFEVKIESCMSVVCTAERDRAPAVLPMNVELVIVTAQPLVGSSAELPLVLLLHMTATGRQLSVNDVPVM